MAVSIEKVYEFSGLVGGYVETFLSELNSEHTAKAYRGDFKRFVNTVFKKEINTITKKEIESIDYDTIIEYRKSMELAPNTINRHVNSIKGILLYLKGRKVVDIDLDFFKIIRDLKKQVEEIPHMPMEVVHEFIEAAKEETQNGKLKANLLMFAVDSGLRQSEIMSLTKSNFKKEGNQYLLTGYGKGNKKYVDTISEEVYEKLMETYQENEEELIFYPLSARIVRGMMIRLREKLGYENEKYSFHSLRKTSITYAHDMTGSLLTAQRKANHSSSDTTNIYIEKRNLEMTGYFSTKDIDNERYQKVEHEELLAALEEMPSEFLQILNSKLRED